MPVPYVVLESDAYLVCLTHALSNERQEVMGLLIGEVDVNTVVHISAVIVLRRSDKRPDRVEISPEQLSDAYTKVERLAELLERPMRVIGWYHSHPHITVCPSHVDIKTQADYQMMDENFIGLIFSVFNEDKHTKHNKIQVTCFQAVSPSGFGSTREPLQREVPLKIVSQNCINEACLAALLDLPVILKQEEEEAYKTATATVAEADLISHLHNSAVFSKSLCHVMDIVSTPLINMLENKLKIKKARLQQLEKQEKELEEKLHLLQADADDSHCVTS